MFEFRMTGVLEALRMEAPSGRSMTYRVVFLPPDLEATLFTSPRYLGFRKTGRVRFRGEVEDIPVELAWQPARDRGHYAMLSPAICKQLAIGLGDEVALRFDLVDADVVDLPADVDAFLAKRPRDRARWVGLTPGKQRALLAFVASARQEATRQRRVADLFAPLAKLERRKASRPRRLASKV
jgi:hypothetical protein